jgi:hypothetical protein
MVITDTKPKTIRRWFHLLFHFHEWEVIWSERIAVKTKIRGKYTQTSVTEYHQKCTVCGKLRMVELGAASD